MKTHMHAHLINRIWNVTIKVLTYGKSRFRECLSCQKINIALF